MTYNNGKYVVSGSYLTKTNKPQKIIKTMEEVSHEINESSNGINFVLFNSFLQQF